jgi:hypothetical protein
MKSENSCFKQQACGFGLVCCPFPKFVAGDFVLSSFIECLQKDFCASISFDMSANFRTFALSALFLLANDDEDDDVV